MGLLEMGGGGLGPTATTLTERRGKEMDALLSHYYVPGTLHALSQLPEITFGISLVYKKIHK